MKRVFTTCLLALGLVTSLPAQEDSRLLGAVRMAQDGKGDSARAIVLDLLSQTPQADTLFPQIVYTMGLVARDAGDRSRNFRRVAVEFAGSSWADDALLGLAQEDFAAGRVEASARNIERIRNDYPTSPLMGVAAYWGARAYFELRNQPEACRWVTEGLARSSSDVELQNQLNFYQPRCSAGTVEPVSAGTPAPPATQPETPAASPPATIATGTGKFTVQIAAAATEDAAQSTATSLRQSGYDPHIVREGGYIKVRVGRFSTRTEAVAAASQVRAKLGGSPFVVEEP
jgi:hypothetical protein